MKNTKIEIIGQIGRCGGREVFIGFEAASTLYKLSFADILDENTGSGYQRRFNRDHSLSFKKYIQQCGATTIPLTFNLRPECSDSWNIQVNNANPKLAKLVITNLNQPVMAQVDCQHRLGFLSGSPIEFAFMTYIGLSADEEMAIFRDINGKAKGLSSSLLSVTEAKLHETNLHEVKPELFYTMELANNPKSPWYKKLDMGGNSTVGTKRTASFSAMQNAVKRFLKTAILEEKESPQLISEILIDYWLAISYVLADAWSQPKKHFLNKSIGVYSLMSLAGDFFNEAKVENAQCNQEYFITKLSDFIDQIDWSSSGPLKGFGGVTGADAALEMLRQTRELSINKLKNYGKQEYSFN